MSAGPFIDSKYEATYNAVQIHPIRIQPETLQATIDGVLNDAPVGDVSNQIPARVSKNKRQFGLRPRLLRVKYEPPNIPVGYDPNGGILEFPILTLSAFAAIKKTSAIDYLGVSMTVVGVSIESTGNDIPLT